MNEAILNTFAEVAVTLAGFSGVAVVFRLRGAQSWSPTELRYLWLLIGDSFLVLFFSLLPFPLAIANWSDDALWGLCNALLGSWFIVGDVLALRGERRDRIAQQLITVPVISPILYIMSIGALAMGIALWLSALDLLVLTELAARLAVKEAGPRVEPWVPAQELSCSPWPGPGDS
jgi:hypothetical protein